MTQEEKQLLLVDLCARLHYGVMISHRGLVRPLFSVSPTQHFQITLDNAIDREHNGLVYVSLDNVADDVKPYLRSMSSMTEEERHELQDILDKDVEILDDFIHIVDSSRKRFSFLELQAVFDWLNAHHFDYHGLIEKGLAIAVTEDNNPYKE